MRIALRPPGAQDLKILAEVHRRSWSDAYRDVYPEWFLLERDNPPFFHGLWQTFLEDDLRLVLAAEVDGTLTGFVRYGRPTAHTGVGDGRTGEILTMYVLPEGRSAGVGSRLLAAGEQALARLGYTAGVLSMVEGREGTLRFYERHGWTVTRRTAVDFGGFTPQMLTLGKQLPIPKDT